MSPSLHGRKRSAVASSPSFLINPAEVREGPKKGPESSRLKGIRRVPWRRLPRLTETGAHQCRSAWRHFDDEQVQWIR
jgi:hypothetical protein